MYEEGLGVPKDLTKASELNEDAAVQGHVEARLRRLNIT